MPKINQYNQIEISVEKFLNACSSTELIELDMLLNKEIYRNKMQDNVYDHKKAIPIDPHCPHAHRSGHFSDLDDYYEHCDDCGLDL